MNTFAPRHDSEGSRLKTPRRSAFAATTGGFLLALVCAGLAACGPTAPADAAGTALDTSRLPRVAGAKELYANPFSTLYTTPMPVAETAGVIKTSLTSGGWKAYVAPFTDYAKSPEFQILSFKKGPQALQVSVSLAPAQGNATSVSYTAIVLAGDLPFPADATDIAFSPERPYLSCATAKPVAETRDFFTKELAAMGWSLWPGLAIQAAKRSDNAAAPTAAHAYFVRDQRQPLHLVLHRGDDGRTKVELEAVPPEMLTAELTPDAPQQAPEMRVHAQKPADPMDDMIENAMQQMTEAILKATGEAVAHAGKPTTRRTNSELKAPAMLAMPEMPAMPKMPEMPAMEDAADASAEPATQELVAEDMDGFPVPENRTSTHSGESKFRLERETTVPAPLASVLAFYRRELPKHGVKETDMLVEGGMTVLKLTTPTGQGALSLRQADGETAVSFIERREAEAKKAGILPKSGQAKLIFGSMAETPATVKIGKQTIKLEPGMGGGDKPDGPMLDLAPGKYSYSVAVPGAPATTEEMEVAEGEAWALVIGPGGGSMPLHIY